MRRRVSTIHNLAGVVMTGHGSIDTAVKALQTGALDYIQKPLSLKVLLPVIGRALAARRLTIENEELARRVRVRTLELEAANAELDAANKELEAFSYSVSHDLRAPLRAVQGYCRIFSEDFGPDVPDAGRELLTKALAGAERMDQLIGDLLALSKCSRRPARPLAGSASRRIREMPPASHRSGERGPRRRLR